MSGTDHPPSTTSPSRLKRRALATSVAAIAAIAAPVALVAATAGGTELRSSSAASDATTTTSVLEEVAEVRAMRQGAATLANVQTAAPPAPPTTVAPPAPTTTAPPPPPAPAPAPVASGTGHSDPNNPAAWDRLAQCEAGGNWAANTGNGYYGGIQFSLSSWQAVGGAGQPNHASRETQIAMGQRLWNQGGWQHWPACSSRLGYR